MYVYPIDKDVASKPICTHRLTYIYVSLYVYTYWFTYTYIYVAPYTYVCMYANMENSGMQ